LWTRSTTDDPAPEGAYRVTLDRSDFPLDLAHVEDQIGVYTLSLEMGSWRLLQVKPSGETREKSGTYSVDAEGRLLLTDRNDPGLLRHRDVGELVADPRLAHLPQRPNDRHPDLWATRADRRARDAGVPPMVGGGRLGSRSAAPASGYRQSEAPPGATPIWISVRKSALFIRSRRFI